MCVAASATESMCGSEKHLDVGTKSEFEKKKILKNLKRKRLVQTNKACEKVNCLKFIVLFISRYFAENTSIFHVIKPVLSKVDFMCPCGYNHHHFYEFLSELESEYLNFPYHTAF